MNRPTIKDVSKRASVSLKILLRVINNEPSVRDDTRERIRHAIDERNRAPDQAAGSLLGTASHRSGRDVHSARAAHRDLWLERRDGRERARRGEGEWHRRVVRMVDRRIGKWPFSARSWPPLTIRKQATEDIARHAALRPTAELTPSASGVAPVNRGFSPSLGIRDSTVRVGKPTS